MNKNSRHIIHQPESEQEVDRFQTSAEYRNGSKEKPLCPTSVDHQG